MYMMFHLKRPTQGAPKLFVIEKIFQIKLTSFPGHKFCLDFVLSKTDFFFFFNERLLDGFNL